MLYTLPRLDKTLSKNNQPRLHFLYQQGFSLIEVMVTLTIAAVLSLIAVPSMQSFIVDLRVDNEISTLKRLLLSARNHAINSGDKVVVCPLSTSGDCSSDWHEELSVFIDINNNKSFDSNNGEVLLRTKSAITLGDILIYAKMRKSITYHPTGHLSGLSNGTFRYCPKGFIEKSRGIVIATSGRFYSTTDINKDGKDETRSNKIITCD